MNDVVPTKFLIDGIDRLGKSSLIKNIQEELGYHLIIHYDKPKLLEHHLKVATRIYKEANPELGEYLDLNPTQLAYRLYQEETNINMFELIKTNIPIIFDRTHLGEMVYAPLYRGYSGEYVYALEREYISCKPYSSHEDVKLILLTTSNFEMLPDDGLSFDPSKKQEEQALFIQAFNKSSIPNKVIVDVHNGNGQYKSYIEVFEEAINKIS